MYAFVKRLIKYSMFPPTESVQPSKEVRVAAFYRRPRCTESQNKKRTDSISRSARSPQAPTESEQYA